MPMFADLPNVQALLEGADHVDVKIVEGEVSLRQFLAGMIGYQPGWVTALYAVRAVFVRFLGMKQAGLPHALHLAPEQVPMVPGAPFSFFTVRSAAEERYFFADVRDSHLTATAGVVVERLAGERRRFHVITIVRYHNWAGPVYFNVIRPFHHMVVEGMAQAGVGRRATAPAVASAR